MKRFLITTALEESWRDDVPVLFLGEWCRRHSREDRWKALDAQVLPYHWDDRAKLHADYIFLQQLYARLLPALAQQLNRMHGVDHSERYWRILVGPWLAFFVQILFDRWTCIEHALARYEVSGTIILEGAATVPNDMDEFRRLYVDDGWNHHIYALILRQLGVPEGVERRATRVEAAAGLPPPSLKRRARTVLAGWVRRGAGMLARADDAFLMSTYLPRREEFRLSWRLGQVPQFWRSSPAPRVQAAPDRRRWSLGDAHASGFERCVRSLIVQQMPSAYLEGYARLAAHCDRLPWPRRPKLIWTSNAHIADDVFKAWTADKVQQGARLVIGQHGGHYGVGRWSFNEEHELAISDRYLSWGWTDDEQPTIAAAGMLKAARPLGVRHAGQPGALLVTTTVPRYSYWMYSIMVAGQWLGYFEDQCTFVKCLPAHIADALTVRLYANDYGWDQHARWRAQVPAVRLDDGSANINTLIRRSRLVISSYNATTFLEAISMNVPTVIFWNPAHWELRDAARPYFNLLREAGIFHASPESAARFVATVWDDVDAWWSSAPVISALARFSERYCLVSEAKLDRIEAALRSAPATKNAVL